MIQNRQNLPSPYASYLDTRENSRYSARTMNADLVILRAFYSEPEARVVESFLKAHGLFAEVFGGRVPYSAAVGKNGPFNLMVRADEETTARAKLAEVEGDLTPQKMDTQIWIPRVMFVLFTIYVAWKFSEFFWN